MEINKVVEKKKKGTVNYNEKNSFDNALNLTVDNSLARYANENFIMQQVKKVEVKFSSK